MRALPFFLLACACGSTQSVPPVPPTLPTLAGRPVYDVPIEEAPPVVRAGWSAASRLLDDPAPSAPDERVAWMRDRATTLADLEDALAPLAESEPRDRVFASVVLASLLDDLFEQTRELPAMVEDPEVRRSFSEIVAVFGLAARGQYLRCHANVGEAPEPLRAWAEHCNTRAGELLVLTERSEEPAEPPLAACEREEIVVDPEAPPRDESAPAEIAIVHDGGRFTGGARDRLLEAVRRRLDALRDEPIVPLDEVRSAERLVSERRWTDGGPVCGQPPPLAALLAERHRNLIIALVEMNCGEGGSCSLSVTLRPADESETGMQMTSAVIGSTASLQSWLRAAARLEPSDASIESVAPIQLGLTYRVIGSGDDDPWLRLVPTLRYELRLVACAPQGTVGLYDVSLAISETGAVERATVRASVPPSGADGEAIARCLEERLRAISFPCPRSGAATEVAFGICLGR